MSGLSVGELSYLPVINIELGDGLFIPSHDAGRVSGILHRFASQHGGTFVQYELKITTRIEEKSPKYKKLQRTTDKFLLEARLETLLQSVEGLTCTARSLLTTTITSNLARTERQHSQLRKVVTESKEKVDWDVGHEILEEMKNINAIYEHHAVSSTIRKMHNELYR